MDTLQARLDAIREGFAAKVPEATRAIMHRATQVLIDSGQADRSIAVGAALPEFAGALPSGVPANSRDLLGHGPLIITFFRGHW